MKKCLGAIVSMVVLVAATAVYGEVQDYNGRPMQRVACSLSGPNECASAGGRRVDDVGIWIGDSLHWRYTDVTTPRDPRSPSAITASTVIRSTILQPVSPKDAGSGRRSPGRFRADIFYNTWEGDFSEGVTYGLIPSIAFGNALECIVRLPLYASGNEDEILFYHLGADMTLQAHLSDYFKIGVHGAYTHDEPKEKDFGHSHAEGYINGGAFAAAVIPLGNARLSLGALYEYGLPEDAEDGDESTVVGLAANLGLPFGQSLAANLYGIHYLHTDTELSDYDFTDAGADLVIALGETWAVSLGAKAVLGLDHLDSTEFYFGTEWCF